MRWPLPVFFLTLCLSSAFATELHLSNGDRITGVLPGRVDGKIHFRSPLLGEIVVAENQAVVVETPDTPVESLAGLPPGAVNRPAGPVPGSPNFEGGRKTTPPWRGK